MKKSTKLLVLLLSTFMVCAAPAVISGCKDKDDNQQIEQTQDAVKLKDGIALPLQINASSSITVSEYVTANGNTVTAVSSNPDVATAALANGVVTVTGKAQGTANVKIKCGTVEVIFAVTVTEDESRTPAPVFEDKEVTLDLGTDSSIDVTLAPKSGGDGFTCVYTLASNLITGASISGNTLTFTPAMGGSYEITVNVTCTETADTQNVYEDISFKVTITVEDDTVYYTVTVNGVDNRVAEGGTFTLPATYTGTIPEGKKFKCWKIGAVEHEAGEEIPVDGNVTVEPVFEDKTYTVSIDGVAQTVTHGQTITLPTYEGTIPSGKQFGGWQVESEVEPEVKTAGSVITVKSDLTITAIIENIPDTPPVLVQASGTVQLEVGTGNNGTATIQISDYITTNGHAVSVSGIDTTKATADSTTTAITLTAVAEGSTSLTITCGTVTATITVNVVAPATLKQTTVTDSVTHDLYDGALTIDLAENINNVDKVASYKVNGAAVTGSTYAVTGSYTEDAQQVTYTITAVLQGGGNLEYTYKVTVKDTTAYRIKNGDFDDWNAGKPVDWTVTANYGSEQTASTYWTEKRPFDNIGSYFGETDENKTGTLQSSTFKVGNSGWVTFQLGSANPDAAIWVEIVKVGTTDVTIAKFKNVQWSDPDNAQRLIAYKVDLSEYSGESVYIKIVDEQASGTMGFRTFFADSFNSWYDAEPTTIKADNGSTLTFVKLGAPAFNNATAAIDLKTGNSVSVTLPDAPAFGMLTGADCTYTTTTSGASISGKTLTFTAAECGTYPVTVTGTNKYGTAQFTVTVTVTNTKEKPVISDENIGQINIDSQTLSISKALSAGNADFNCSYAIKTAVEGASVSGTQFTYTAPAGQQRGTVEVTLVATFTDKVYSAEVYTQEFTLSITIVGNNPTVNEQSVTYKADLNGNNSAAVELDLAANVTVPDSISVTYSVTGATGTVNGSTYNATLAAGTHNLTVTVNYDGGSVSYAYVVKVAQYSVKNGDFETGDLTDWTYTVATGSTDFGRITNETYYWKNPDKLFNKQGTYLFTGVETKDPHQEAGKGTLRSSNFVLKQNGWISFLMGGAHNVACGVRVKTADGTVLAEFNNVGKGVDATMDRYIYKFAGMQSDLECYIEVFDDATGGWGLVTVDDFRTDWGDTEPNGAGYENKKVIVPVYVSSQTQVYNGTFDMGDFSGWTLLTDGMTTGVINADTYWGERLPFNNSGYFLSGFDTGIAEPGSWAVRSSHFTLAGSGYISVRMGGNAAVVKVYKANGTVVGTYKPNHFSPTNFPYEGDGAGKGSWAGMRTYFIDLSDHIGEELYIELHDTGSGDWAHAFFDEVVTYYATEPDIANGFDTVTAPVGKQTVTNDEGQQVEEYVYAEVQLKWCIAE